MHYEKSVCSKVDIQGSFCISHYRLIQKETSVNIPVIWFGVFAALSDI